jgi:hypothetical protein
VPFTTLIEDEWLETAAEIEALGRYMPPPSHQTIPAPGI